MKYQLIITKEQSEVIIKALDLFSRIGSAQFDEVLKHPQWDNRKLVEDDSIWKYESCNRLLAAVKRLLTGFPENASYGIGAPEVDEGSKMAYDILQVIRRQLAWDENPKGGVQVDFCELLQFAKHELPEIKEKLFPCPSNYPARR